LNAVINGYGPMVAGSYYDLNGTEFDWSAYPVTILEGDLIAFDYLCN